MARLRNASGVVVTVDDAKVARLGIGWEPVGDSSSSGSQAEGYEALTVDELKDEIRARNENRDDDTRLALTGNKAELVAALEADDE
jgi:hypothetical protein